MRGHHAFAGQGRLLLGLFVLLSAISAGALFWLGMVLIAQAWIGPPSPVTPLVCFATGAYWAATILPWAAHMHPGGLVAAGDEVPVAMKLSVYALGLGVGLAYILLSA